MLKPNYMKPIEKTITVSLSHIKAFDSFISDINSWWPKKYTWSQEKLKEIRIERKTGGLCTEIGPHGFRCDWGRVIHLAENETLFVKWQIGSKREPVPDPDNASDLKISFAPNHSKTLVTLQHMNFDNHGVGAEEYRNLMNSETGWDYILSSYRSYCEST